MLDVGAGGGGIVCAGVLGFTDVEETPCLV